MRDSKPLDFCSKYAIIVRTLTGYLFRTDGATDDAKHHMRGNTLSVS